MHEHEPSRVYRLMITPAKNAAEAKAYLGKGALPLSAAHGALLRGALQARDAADEASVKAFTDAAEKLREAMGYLAAVEAFLYNESRK